MKILVVHNPDINACQAYRLIYPYTQLKNYFSLEIDFCTGIENFSAQEIKQYNIAVFHKDYCEINELNFLKEQKIKTIVDFDDYWLLSNRHILFNTYKKTNNTQKLEGILRAASVITTTTERLAAKIKPYNKNVYIFENSFNNELPQFIVNKEPEKKLMLRYGYLGGITHKDDVMLLQQVLPELNKMNIEKTKKGESIMPYVFYLFGYRKEERVMNDYADIITDFGKYVQNFRGIPPLNIYNFPTMYNNVDIVFAPLQYDIFNSMKSELKIVEAGFMKKCVIASDVYPYKNHIKDGVNGYLASSAREFAKISKYLYENPENIQRTANNLYEYVKKNFNFNRITEKRKTNLELIIKS